MPALRNWMLWLGVAALGAALALYLHGGAGNGRAVIISTLAAGGGWLLRQTIDEARTQRTICQAYAGMIEIQYRSLMEALSDDELTRFLDLAPRIARGDEAESLGVQTPDPFAQLPDLKANLHVLTPETVRALQKWRDRSPVLLGVYDQIGTKRLSAISRQRLEAYFKWVQAYRDEYRDLCYMALIRIRMDSGISTAAERLRSDGARYNTEL
jgi:hypothetical protein